MQPFLLKMCKSKPKSTKHQSIFNGVIIATASYFYLFFTITSYIIYRSHQSFQSIILFGAMEIISTILYPRCLHQRLHQGETVTIVGQVVSLDEANRRLVIQPDLESQMTVQVSLPESMQCAELRGIKFIEVRGTAESGQQITLKQYCNFKDNFDLKTYNEVLRLTADPNFRHIFGNK